MGIKKMPYFMLSAVLVLIVAFTAAWNWNARNKAVPKYYIEALYEQVFNEGFEITEEGYPDGYNVRWSGEELTAKLISEDYIDSGSALVISNETNSPQKLTVIFDDFLKREKSKLSGMKMSFYARKISEAQDLDITMEVDGASKRYKEKLEHRWSCYNDIAADITKNTKTMKMTIEVKPGQQFKLDELVIVKK
ncbi:MAG TPA: hypothetical protein VN580_06690 [Clostridia bacterium]|nr:hypothetical protein [Clostridia bacterium]